MKLDNSNKKNVRMFDISIIIPIYNGEKWIANCMKSIDAQTIFKTETKVQIVVHNDGSSDKSQELLENWCKYFLNRDVHFVISKSVISIGVGAAKNAAVKCSSGEFLCFQDVDDIMLPNRILLQYEATKCNCNTLTGSKISRQPLNSTPRLVRWANNLTRPQLKLQIYTSNGPTLLMPTWFCHRSVYDRVGGFIETGCGTPEDLIFFNAHIDVGGDLHRVDENLVIYTYHEGAATFSVKRECIWKIQLDRLEKHVLANWEHFTIWNAGKAGRKLVRALNSESLKKVQKFCDVDANKIGKIIELYSPAKRNIIVKLPVIHFREAQPPLIICVKLDLTNGEFENNLKSLNLIEGIDYVIFS